MKYRREVDGLRALAVVPVILFHAGFAPFSGGFVGVDVFFVISGYLITSIIQADLEEGSFSIAKFYERRARRILPALFVVMAVSMPFAWMWLHPDDLRSFWRSVASVSAFASNILFWRESGYFNTAAELKPLLHTWSLAVEEQFYLLFPLFLLLAWRAGRKTVMVAIAIAALLSVSIAHLLVVEKPEAAFFLLPTRAWELAIGALLALSERTFGKQAIPPFANQILSCIGVAMIGGAVFLFSEATPFPSAYALVPTIGTTLVIAFARPETFVGRVLGSAPFVGIGLISYSAYLWHQPIFAFARHRSLSPLDPSALGLLAMLALLLGYVSWKFVEKPFREPGRISRAHVAQVAVLGSAFFLLVGFAGQRMAVHLPRGEHASDSVDQSDIRSACSRSTSAQVRAPNGCSLGEVGKGENAKIAVFGDSHSVALLPAFDALGKATGQQIVHMGLEGCAPLLGADVIWGNHPSGACARMARQQFEYAKQNRIAKVFLVARWSLYTEADQGAKKKWRFFLVSGERSERTEENSRAVFAESLLYTVRQYSAINAQVYLIDQVPEQLVDAGRLSYKIAKFSVPPAGFSAIIDGLSVPHAAHLERQRFNREVMSTARSQGLAMSINLDSLFCWDGLCRLNSGTEWLYLDRDHINAAANRLVATYLRNFL